MIVAQFVALSALQPPGPHQEPRPGFAALWQGRSVTVTAVLERTAVVLVDGEKVLVRKPEVSVDPDRVEWVTVRNSAADRYRAMRLDSPEVRRARAREAADVGAIGSGFHRFSPAEAGHGWLTGRCSECGTPIRPDNKCGICIPCRRRCACGGPKQPALARCQACASAARRASASEAAS